MKIKMCIVVLIGMIVTTKSLSQNLPNYVPKNGLVGYWPFNGNINDESGNGNNGILTSGSYDDNRDKINNSAVKLFSNNDFVYGKGNKMNNPNFTISAWIYINSLNYTTLNIFKYDGGNVELVNGYRLFANLDGSEVGLQFYNNSERITLAKTISKLNQWVNLIAVKNGPKAELYVNGILVEDTIFSNEQISFKDDRFQIGSSGNENNGELGNRLIDDIALWNRSLSQNEIKSIFLDCQKQTATTTSLDKIILTNSGKFSMNVIPVGGTLHGTSVINNQIDPSKSKLGRNNIDYFFKNDSGCDDSTRFTYVVYDTLGLTCTKTTYDTIITKTTVTDTLKIKVGITTGLYVNQVNLIRIFPNPTASDLVIDFGNQEMIKGYSLTITDLNGKQVHKESIQTQKSIVKLSSLGGKGLYFVNIIDVNSKVLVVKQIILE